MRISPVQNRISVQQNFKANNRWVIDHLGVPVYKTTTYCFRDDLIWRDLILFLSKTYKDVPKVNVVAHACSNGMEPLSFLMALFTFAPKDAEKFLPVIAKDINKENILMAKKNSLGISFGDFHRIRDNTDCKYIQFLDIERGGNIEDFMTIKPKKILTDNIIYEQGDIFEDAKNLPKENTVLFCRNMWMYLHPYNRKRLAEKLGGQLERNSNVILGYLDEIDGDAGMYLANNGFKKVYINNDSYHNIIYSKS